MLHNKKCEFKCKLKQIENSLGNKCGEMELFKISYAELSIHLKTAIETCHFLTSFNPKNFLFQVLQITKRQRLLTISIIIQKVIIQSKQRNLYIYMLLYVCGSAEIPFVMVFLPQSIKIQELSRLNSIKADDVFFFLKFFGYLDLCAT